MNNQSQKENTIDNNLNILEENINNVNLKIDNVLTKTIETSNAIQGETEKAIQTLKKENAILNAKQTILMLQNEYDRKYKYRDVIRRRVTGLIQGTDINAIKKTTIESLGEDTIINNPDYWLAPALLAICAWYTNDKEKASKALSKALTLDAEMTSLFFCFIHLRIGRINTATIWLEKYLNMQTIDKMNSRIILILNSIISGIFPIEMQEISLNKINYWLDELKNTNLKQEEKERWTNFFKELNENNLNNNNYPYIKEYTDSFERISVVQESINNSKVIETYIKNINDLPPFNQKELNSEIDEIINDLIYNHDDEEEEITSQIYKNKCIIENNGDTIASEKLYNKNYKYINAYASLYTHLTNICIINSNKKLNTDTIKLALAILKDIIKEAYLNIANIIENNKEINITLLNSKLITTNGSNENELINELNNDITKKYYLEHKKVSLIGIDNIISFIILLVILVLFHKILMINIIIFIAFIVYNLVIILKRNKYLTYQKNELIMMKHNNKTTLQNIIAEIVDIYFEKEDQKENKENFIKYLDSLNPYNYFKTSRDDQIRRINIGGTYE